MVDQGDLRLVVLNYMLSHEFICSLLRGDWLARILFDTWQCDIRQADPNLISLLLVSIYCIKSLDVSRSLTWHNACQRCDFIAMNGCTSNL